MTNNSTKFKNSNWLTIITILTMFLPAWTSAQVNVTASAGTASASYLTLKESFDAINAGTHMGVISIDISASTTETATASLDASGAGSTNYSAITISTTGGPWTIGGSIVAGNPLITFNGADNVTVNGGNNLIFSNTTASATSGTSTLKLMADATNNIFNNVTFLGSASVPLATNGGIVFISTGTTTGNDNNSFQSCKFSAAGVNFPSKAIYGNGSTANAGIANANITINNCEIYDYFLAGGCAGIYALTGNTNWNITNNLVYQTSARAMTSTMNGIYFSNSTYGNNVQITGNTIGYSTNLSAGTLSLTGTGSFQGIYFNGMSTAANACNLNNNIISDISLTSTTGTFNGIVNASSASSNTINIIANRVKNITLLTTTGTVYGINWGSATSMDVTYNYVYNITRTGAGTTYGIASSASSTNENISNNLVYDLNSSAATASTINGIYQNTASGTKLFQNNSVYNLSGQGGTSINGIYVGYGTTVAISGNTIHNLMNTGGTSGTMYGIQRGTIAATVDIYKNKIYSLSTTSTGPALSGIYVAGGTTSKVYNNLIGDLTASAANAAIPLSGINIGGGTTSNIYYNTVLLNATSSGALFGSAAIYASSTPNLDLRNNILVNTSVPSGAGISSAYRRSSTTLTSYASTSNNNLFYTGTPSANTAIFTDGTNTYQTLAAYKTAMATRDQSSITENPTFFSTTGSSFNFLHINNFVPTAIESGAGNISGIADDFDADVRQGNAGYAGTGTSPDIGADEFEGTSPAPIINSVSITPTGNACVAISHNVTANVTPGSSTLTGVTLYYAFNGAAQTPITMTGGSFTTTSTWNATIPVGIPTNANVTWYVEVTDGVFTKSSNGTSYKDEPLTGVLASVTASLGTICAGSSSTLSVNFGNPTTAPSYTLPPAVTNPTTDEDLGSVIFGSLTNTTAINSLVGSIGTASGVAGSYSNFTAFGPYAFAAGSTYSLSLSSLQQTTAYGNAFGVYIDYNRNGSFADAGEAVYVSTVTVLGAHTETANITIPVTAKNGLTRMRIVSNEGLVTGSAMTVGYGEYEEYMLNISSSNQGGGPVSPFVSYAWSDGTSTVATTSIAVVSPTANTTYSLTATDGNGCSITTAPVTVTVTPLPSAPTATNSSQCGVAVPSSSVSGGTSYNWYASPTSTNVLQSGSSSNFTLAIGSTATWYVTSVNGTCESSTRTAVTTTVSIPDGVTANTSSSNLCVGGANTVTLTAVQSGTTNPYTFSWDASPVSGSGMPTTVSGATVSVTPTLPGTYSYSVTATDGICTTISSVNVSLNNLPDISNATATPTAICSGSTFSLNANTIVSGSQTVPTGYCTPSSSGSACITMVSFNTLSRISACEAGNYISIPSSSVTTNVTPGQTYTLSLTANSSAITSVWFDWNRDGVFSSTEWLQPSTTGTTGIVAVTVPMSAGLGLTKMRLRSRSSGNVNGSVDACTSFGSGEAEDYTINVQFDQSSDYTWTWNPGSLSGNSVTSSATNTTSSAVTEVYTVTATSTVTGCSNTATTSIVVNPIPSTPVATDATQCGVGVPTASVSGGTLYNWYSSPTSTVVLQSGASANYTTSINATTTWYIESSNGSCVSPKVALTQTVTTPPVFTLNSPAAICAGSEIGTFSVTSNTSDYDSYIWSPTANIFSDAAATTAYTGSNATQVYVMSLTPGVLTINANATNSVSGCAAMATTTISIKNAPTSITVSATPTLICSGNTTTLTAGATPLPVVLLNEGFNGATNSWTTLNTSTGGTATAAAWTLRNSPFTSNVGTGMSSNDASQFYLTDSDAQGSGGTTGTVLQSPAINTMGMSSINLSFFHYYNYYTSDVSAKVEVSTNGTTWTSIQDYKTGAVDVGTATSFTMASFNLNSYVNYPTVYVRFNYNSAYGYGWAVDNVLINGLSNNAYDFSWTSSPAGFTSATSAATDMPTGTTNYSVVITNTNTSCSNSGVVTVSVNPTPTVTASASSASVCAGSSATLTAGGATSFTWTSGGSTSTEVVTPSSASVYTVTGTDNGCSNTATVSVGVNSLPTVTAMASNTLLCSNLGESAVLTASTSATSYSWSNGANTMTTTVTPTSGTTYTLVVNDGNCDGMATIFVDAQICSGINGVAIVSEINIYPNPTNGILNVSISSQLAGNTSIEVYDGLGKLAIKENLSNDTNTISLSKLEDGIYFFKIINNNKAIKVGKVVKQ